MNTDLLQTSSLLNLATDVAPESEVNASNQPEQETLPPQNASNGETLDADTSAGITYVIDPAIDKQLNGSDVGVLTGQGSAKNAILGTEEADWPLMGTTGDDVIFGLAGQDRLEGLDGNDHLVGGAGNDQLLGGNGNDTLIGTDDVVLGQGEVDRLTGGAGQDRFILGNSENFYYDGDQWFGLAVLKDFTVGEDVAVLHGSAGQYALEVNLEQNATRLYSLGNGAEPWDEIALFEGNTSLALDSPSFEFLGNKISGTEEADFPLTGSNWDDSIFGLAGQDRLEGLDGNDRLVGGQDNDQLVGGNGNDTLIGTDDVALGQGEVDRLTGGAGQDRFILGNSETSYYFGDDWFGLAVLKDFTVGEDVAVLHGSAEQYVLQVDLEQNATRLYSLGNGVEQAWDEIALFEGNTDLNLASASFEFVG